MNTEADNPFELLGLPPRYDLDPGELQKAFIRASAANHPDLSTDPQEQLELTRRSAAINRAHGRLKDPLERAAALLEYLGHPIEPGNTDLPDGFLELMLEQREQMAEAQAEGDAEAIDELRRWTEQEQTERQAQIAALFDGADRSNPPSAETLEKIVQQTNALRYLQRMDDQLDSRSA
jgi:molecular chaperone HscB